jgi:hypothetical protein
LERRTRSSGIVGIDRLAMAVIKVILWIWNRLSETVEKAAAS